MKENVEEIKKAIKKKGARWIAKKTEISELSEEEKKNRLGHVSCDKKHKKENSR